MRSFSELLPAMGVLMIVGAGDSYASELSEVTVGPARSPQSQTLTAHAIEYTPTLLSEVTIGPGSTSAAPSGSYVAGNEPYPGESTVSEVTIQPGPFAPAPSTREALATSGSPPDGAVKPADKIAVPKTKLAPTRH